MGNQLISSWGKYTPTAKELTFDPTIVPGLEKELRFDPFPREIRIALEKRAVRDVVNLIAEYARYSTLDYSRPANHWGMTREVEYRYSEYGHYTLTNANLSQFLYFLRLAGTHLYLDRKTYASFEKLSQRSETWQYPITASSTLAILKLGQEIHNDLAIRRPISSLEKFFYYFWSPQGYRNLRDILDECEPGYTVRWEQLALPGDEGLQGIIFVYSMRQDPGGQITYPERITTAYFARKPRFGPYNPEEFIFYFRQLLSFYLPDSADDQLVYLVKRMPDRLSYRDVFG